MMDSALRPFQGELRKESDPISSAQKGNIYTYYIYIYIYTLYNIYNYILCIYG